MVGAAMSPSAGIVITDWRRHQLVWPDADGWRRVLAPAAAIEPWGEPALAVLRHWADHDLPLVVTRQPVPLPSGRGGPSSAAPIGGSIAPLAVHSSEQVIPGPADKFVMVGLPAPLRWERQRLFIELPVGAVRRVGAFAAAREINRLLAPEMQPAWRRLCDEFIAMGLTVRVHGSYGWQQLSRLVYLHGQSDIDLHVDVDSTAQADALVAILQAAAQALPRLDGELVFAGGAAVAWREWAQWRAGSVDRVLVKRLHGVALEDPAAFLGEVPA
jgi:phosphoribosyl-dephospho-CoA transferase